MSILERLSFRQVRQNLGCNLCKIGAERKKKNGSCNIKDGVHVCNLCCNVVRSQTLYKGSKWGQDANDGEDDGTDDVEEKMDDSGSLRIACSTNRSQNCCDTGTDVLAKQDWMKAVNSAPARIPSTGLENLVIRLMKVWESRSGIIAELIISIPINRIPKPAMILP